MSGLVKAKKFDIADSNIALLGSDLEKEVKRAAAECEPSWKVAGKKEGMQIWRIEKFKVVAWPEAQYGHFYSGDSYILLRTYRKNLDSPKLSFDIHFWIGLESSQDEYGTAAYKTVELDDYLGQEPVQHREVQGSESAQFLTYFKSITIMQGGVDTGFRHVEPEKYRPRLLHLKGKKNIVCREVPMEREQLNSGDVFVVDGGLKLYQFVGKDASGMERMKAAQLVRSMDDERKGLAKVFVIEETDKFAEGRAEFFGYLKGGEGSIKTKEEGGADEGLSGTRRLFRLSDASGQMSLTEVTPIKRTSLDTNDVFIFDAGFEVFVWIGRGASQEERRKGLGYATDYLSKYSRPLSMPISRILEGGENEVFETAFCNTK